MGPWTCCSSQRQLQASSYYETRVVCQKPALGPVGIHRAELYQLARLSYINSPGWSRVPPAFIVSRANLESGSELLSAYLLAGASLLGQ